MKTEPNDRTPSIIYAFVALAIVSVFTFFVIALAKMDSDRKIIAKQSACIARMKLDSSINDCGPLLRAAKEVIQLDYNTIYAGSDSIILTNVKTIYPGNNDTSGWLDKHSEIPRDNR